jgi:hypothetical protein
MTSWQIWPKQQMRQPSLWGLEKSAGMLSGRCGWQVAVIGRLGDVATKLPDEVIEATPEIPWKQVKGMRISAAHAYHRIDYEEVWVT